MCLKPQKITDKIKDNTHFIGGFTMELGRRSVSIFKGLFFSLPPVKIKRYVLYGKVNTGEENKI